jgi:hypothetical protein
MGSDKYGDVSNGFPDPENPQNQAFSLYSPLRHPLPPEYTFFLLLLLTDIQTIQNYFWDSLTSFQMY